MAARIEIGKLPAGMLAQLLARHVRADSSVLVGPGVGEDAAVIDMGDRCLVAKTDPITFASDAIGWYAVHVNANDVACCGARPRWFLATILLPENDTTSDLVESIFQQMADACGELDVTLCGGHTEITHGLDRPIVIGQMLGDVARGAFISGAGARAGDVIILTKGIALEGTALIAREQAERLAGVMDAEELGRCAGLLRDPGISVVADARLALEAGEVHALHDPTEGGVATGLWELAEAAGLGLRVDSERLPILPECARMCAELGLDPLGLIASGSLLIAAPGGHAEAIIERLAQAKIAATAIGELLPADHGRRFRAADGSLQPMAQFARDEITRLYQ